MEKTITNKQLVSNGKNQMDISRLVKKGFLGNLGYGVLIKNPVNFKLENDHLMHKINALLDKFPLPPKRMIFSSISLNFCINQLISGNTYIVEVESEYLANVFSLLKANFKNTVLLNPSQSDKINYWQPNIIYVTKLFSRSPTNKDGGITIEKLIVDLLYDEAIYSLYSELDVEIAIETLCSNYTINYETLFAYADRRGHKIELYGKIKKYIPQIIKEVIENDR